MGGGVLECYQHFTPNLTQLMRAGGLLECDQHFTPNLTQFLREGGLLECDQHFTPNLIQLMRVGGIRVARSQGTRSNSKGHRSYEHPSGCHLAIQRAPLPTTCERRVQACIDARVGICNKYTFQSLACHGAKIWAARITVRSQK